ncbi:MAG TPA: response regulator [Pirellulales bacterium]|jgi:two-component system CheB/CheR fusion protein|nr:response regulator [Pirellulales bacterium]
MTSPIAERSGCVRVLVVEDDVDNATVLSRLLVSHGYEAQTCTYAKDALATIEQWRPDAILLDLGMPGIGGCEIARELNETGDLRPALLIACTGRGEPSDREQTAKLGFDHHFVKPVNWHELDAVLRTLKRTQPA